MNEAAAIFSAARKFGLSKSPTLGSLNTRGAFSLFAPVKGGAAPQSLEQALERCIDPELITSPDLWLIVWTAFREAIHEVPM